MLAQLIYVSRRNKAVLMEDINTIVANSTAANAKRGITGMLLCGGEHLMQLLEGELSDVVALYEKIRADKRHTDTQCILCKNVNRRMFPEWGMGLADLDNRMHLDRARLLQLIGHVRDGRDTSGLAIETRLLINDFKNQLEAA